MSLAMWAAPFQNESNDTIHAESNKQTNHANKKHVHSHNKTQRRTHDSESESVSVHSDKVRNVLETIQNLPSASGDDVDELADFAPLPPPTSVGAQRKKMQTTKEGMCDIPVSMQARFSPLQEEQKFLDANRVDKQYQRFLPNYEEMYKSQTTPSHPYYSNTTLNASSNSSSNHDLLLEKLNYMIHLLEENQDEKTGHVTEEVILYSFLGIFMIFLVDSFVRVGKYIR
jgi:hypothetical protein